MYVEFVPTARIRARVPSENDNDLIVFYPTKKYAGNLVGGRLYSSDGKYPDEFEIPLQYVDIRISGPDIRRIIKT